MEKIKPGSLKARLIPPRFHFIPLTVILVSLGTAIAAYEGYFHLGHFLLAMIGSILVQMTVNVINDYYLQISWCLYWVQMSSQSLELRPLWPLDM